jgi:tetratricopeptide (TPR) repeat protein
MAAVVYSNTARYGFVFDDVEGILNNPLITRFTSLSKAAQFLREPWRALTQFSYALTILFAGPNPRVFHVTNIVIHLCNSLLVFGIARLVARRWISTEKSQVFAIAAALIHAVHPLYSQAVAYVWGRSSSLCASFYFGSLLLTMLGYQEQGRKRYLWYGLAAAAGILAWKTKEEAITLPFVIAGFLMLAGSWRAAAAIILVPFSIAAARWSDIVSLYDKVRQNQPLVSAGASPSLDPLVHILTHVKASVFYYLRMFAFPLNQSADPYVEPVTRLADPLLWVSVAVLISLAAWGIRMFKKQPALSFGLLALLVSPLMAYALMPLADVVAEHRVYISGLGFDLLAAWILSRYPRYSYAALAVITLTLGFLTLQRNRVWANSLTLWKDAELKSPELARPHLNLGLAYQTAGRFDEALAEYRHALSVNPKLSLAYVNMGGVYFSRNELDNAESALKRAVELSPSLSEPLVDLAVIALRRNQPAEALELIEKAASLGDSYLVHLNKGDILSQLGRYEDAVREYRRAVELRPDLPQLRQQIEKRLQHLRSMGANLPPPNAAGIK